MMERTAAEAAALAGELRNLLQHSERLVSALREDRADAILDLRERVNAAADEARIRLAEFEGKARRLKDDAGAAVDTYVRGNPWTAVSIGGALGLILGAWLASGGGDAGPVDDDPEHE